MYIGLYVLHNSYTVFIYIQGDYILIIILDIFKRISYNLQNLLCIHIRKLIELLLLHCIYLYVYMVICIQDYSMSVIFEYFKKKFITIHRF